MTKHNNKFRVMAVKDKEGKVIGIRAASINGRVIKLALRDAPPSNWYEAVKKGIPSKYEWMAILENIKQVNTTLKRYGGAPLNGWYWSSSEYGYYTNLSRYAWVVHPGGTTTAYDKDYYSHYVRCVLA